MLLPFILIVGLLSVGCLVAGIWIVRRNYNWAVAVLGILFVVAGALLAFVAFSDVPVGGFGGDCNPRIRFGVS